MTDIEDLTFNDGPGLNSGSISFNIRADPPVGRISNTFLTRP